MNERGPLDPPLTALLDQPAAELLDANATRNLGTAGPKEFVILVTAIMAMGAMAIDLMLPAFPDIRAEFGMPHGSHRVSQIITVFFLGMALGPWLYGPASDRYGRKPLLFAGLCLYVVGAVLASLAPSFGWILAARFVWGMGAAAPRSLSLAMIRDRYEGDAMARLMSMIMAVFILVPILAPGLGQGLNAIAPWRVVFWVPGVLAIAVVIWAQRLPETLAPERRRSFTIGSVGTALKAVLSNRQTVCFTLAVTCCFGVMTGYLASSELLVGDVYGYEKYFPLFFGAIAILMGISALNNARLVTRLGISTLVRRMSVVGLLLAGVFTAIVLASHGKPNFWVFAISLAVVVPMAQGLVPNCNTAAMTPLPHVAGTAAAIIATVSTAGGSLLGGLVSNAFDHTARPFAIHVTVYLAVATALILFGANRRPVER